MFSLYIMFNNFQNLALTPPSTRIFVYVCMCWQRKMFASFFPYFLVLRGEC